MVCAYLFYCLYLNVCVFFVYFNVKKCVSLTEDTTVLSTYVPVSDEQSGGLERVLLLQTSPVEGGITRISNLCGATVAAVVSADHRCLC